MLTGAPVAHETAVLATGARTDESGKRELFKETTTTALVFPSGGVIRLSTAAAPGQLLFLSNPQTQREVVAQVTRRRNNQPAGFYVELEFTEPAPDFWGVEFPEAPADPATATTPSHSTIRAAPTVVAPVAAEFLQPAEPGSDDLSPNAPAPTAGDVQALVEEIEALRAQLKSMQTQAAAPPTPVPAAVKSVPAEPSQPAAAPSPSPTPGQAQEASPSSLPQLELSPKPLSRTAGTSRPPQPPSSPEKAAAPTDDEDLLPTPALDFHQAKVSGLRPTGASSGDRTGLLRLALLAVVSLFAVMAAAWNMHWLPWSTSKAAPESVSSQAVGKPPSAAHAPQSKPIAPASSSLTSQTATAANLAPTSGGTEASVSPIKSSDATGTDPQPAAPASRSNVAANPKSKDAPTSIVSVSKRSASPHESQADSESTSSPADNPAGDNLGIVPPRLIKSVRAVAPGDALRQFMTGNVTLDAIVDNRGRVQSMKVLSGPPSFHKAAMDALKHYRYEPARQNGKPVSAHVTVTIPFWFEP